MKKNMLAVLILAFTIANMILSAIILMIVMPSLKNTNDFVAKVASAIELEEKEKEEEVGIDEMENYVLTKTDESIMINLSNYGSKDNSYAVIKGVSLTLNTKDKDYTKTKKLLKDNHIRVQDIINTTYEGYTKEEAKAKKSQIKNEILDKMEETFESKTIVDISFGSITYQ